MSKSFQHHVWRRPLCSTVAAFVFALLITSARAQIDLGPVNPGFELGNSGWFSGSGGVGTVVLPDPTSNGPSAPGTNDVLIGSTSGGTANHADFRSATFSLGPATGGANPVTFSFDYDILGTVTPGNNIRVGFRTWLANNNNNFEGEINSFIGDNTGDTGGDGWHTFSLTYTPSANANFADIRVSVNVFNSSPGVGDYWSDGNVLFDNFRVTAVPEPGCLALVGLAALGTTVARRKR